MRRKRRRKKRIIIALAVSIFILAAVSLALLLYLTHVKQLFTERTYELGNVDISRDVRDYIECKDFMLEKANLNTSNVRENEVGDYKVSCSVGKKKFTYFIHIVDTTKPAICIKNSGVTFATYNEYKLDDLAEVSDLSDIVKFDIISCINKDDSSIINTPNNTILVETPGNYSFCIAAEDECGNIAKLQKDVVVFEAPHYILLNDRKYKTGNTYKLLDFVYAEDKDGNDISDKITVIDDGGYNAGNAGTYEVTYSVADKDNLERRQSISVEIGDFENNSYGCEKEEFINTIIKHDYFAYTPLENNEDLDTLTALTSPASFGLKGYKENDKAFCSAFIYKITDKYLYFITNKHCAFFFNTYADLHLSDCDGVITSFKASDANTYKSDSFDMMCFAVPIEYFDVEKLLSYKRVAIDEAKFGELVTNQELVVNTQEHGFHDKAQKDVIKKVTLKGVKDTQLGTLSYNCPWLTTNQGILIGGQSGSPLFTLDGYLVGIASQTANLVNPSRNIDMYVRTPDLVEFMNGIDIE